jgi:hypothetical protein
MPLELREYLEDYDDLTAAHEAYLSDFASLEKSGNRLAGIALRFAGALQDNVQRLNESVSAGYAMPALNSHWHSSALIFVGNAGTKLFTKRVGRSDAVLIDLDLVLRLVLMIFVVGLDRKDDVAADGLAAFLLLSIVVPREEEFPYIYDLLECFAGLNGRLLNDIFALVGDFVLYHELGHLYAKQYPTDFLRIAFEIPPELPISAETVSSIRMHPEGAIYNQIESPGAANGILVMAPRFEHWKSEFAADIFASYADVCAGAKAKPKATDLERWASVLTCWQVLLFALGNRQQYMRWIAGDDAEDFSHPVAPTRMDVLIHHVNSLAETFAPEWQSSALTHLRAQYESLWASDLKTLLMDAIEYVRYAFDEDGPDINVGRIHTFTGGPVPRNPSQLSKLGQLFLSPFLSTVRQIGWDSAVRKSRGEYTKFFATFRLNEKPICLQLGKRLRKVNMRLISEDRE